MLSSFCAHFTASYMKNQSYIYKEDYIMNRDERIKKFLEAWNKLMNTIGDIKQEDGFDFQLDVSISSDDKDRDDRIKIIEGINSSFRENGWLYSSEL